MADEIVPQGVAGSPVKRSEPRPAAAPGEPGRGGGAHDGVPEFIEPGVTGDRQSRRYAHTMRRDGVSGPIRAGDAVSTGIRHPEAASAPVRAPESTANAPVRAPESTANAPVRAEAAHAPARAPDAPGAPARPSDRIGAPVRVSDSAGSLPHHDTLTNRSSAPSDSTALYRKRTNPTLPAVSADMVLGAQPVTDTPEVDAAIDAAIDAAMGRPPPPGGDDMPSDLPSVMLDGPARSGLALRPLALPRPPRQVILSIIAAALVVIGLWMMRLAF